MAKGAKKRSSSEGEVLEKVVSPINKGLKKIKVENGAPVQNGQANSPSKKAKKEKKTVQKEGSQSPVKSLAKDTKNDKLAKLKQKQAYREKRKIERQEKVVGLGPKKELSLDELNARIAAIESRGKLTKSAKRKLGGLKKKVHLLQGIIKPAGSVTKKPVKGQPVSEGKNKKNQQKSILFVKPSKDDEDEDEEEDSDEMEVSTEEVESEDADDVEEDDEDDDDDDDEDDEDEDEDEDEDDNDDDDEEDEKIVVKKERIVKKEDSDEEEDEDEEETVVSPPAKGKQVKEVKVKTEKSNEATNQEGKKVRYVLFVGNLPFSVTVDEIKKHFLTKVSKVVDVRIPTTKDTNKSRGFAYVELSNSVDYEKGLSLHNTFIGGRQINVQYSAAGSKAGNKKDVVAKNMKLGALRKAGKLAGSNPKNNKKNFGKKGKPQGGVIRT